MFRLYDLAFPGLRHLRFPDDGAGNSDGGDSGGTESGNSDGTDTEDKSGDEVKFTQSQLDAIVAREKDKAKRGKIDPKELGFESKKELESFLDAMKKKSDEEKSDAEKTVEEAAKKAAEEAKGTVLSTANKRLIKAEFKAAAIDAGVPRNAIDDAFVLAQTLDDWDVSVNEEDEVEGITDEFFKTLKEAKPFLFNASSEEDDEEKKRKGPDAGAGAGGGGSVTGNEAELKQKYPALAHIN